MATELEIRVTAELREIKAALAGLTRDVKGVGDSSGRAAAGTERLAAGLRKSGNEARNAKTEVSGMERGIAGAVAQVRLLAGGLGFAAFVSSIVRAADTTTRLNGQIRLVTKSQEAFNTAQRATFEIAQRTRQGLEGTVGLYARIARTGVATQQQSLGLTETINQAVALSFTTAQAAEAALFQLGQGLGSGTLRGEELNSVLEQTPRLAKAIAEGLVKLGKIKDPGDLRAYAQKNGIDAKLVVQAVETQQKALREEFAKLEPTVADAFTKLKNAYLQFIGQTNDATGASGKLSSAISTLADNFDRLAGVLVLGAQAWGVYFLAFRVGPVVILAFAAAMTRLGVSLGVASAGMTFAAGRAAVLQRRMVEATIAAKGVSLQMTGAQIAAGKLGTKMLALAGVIGAAFIGVEIGNYLRKEFLEVELFGIALAAGLHKAAVTIGQSFKVAGVVTREAFASAFNYVKGKAADMVEAVGKAYGAIPLGAGSLVESTAAKAAASLRSTITSNEGVAASLKRLAAEGSAELAKLDLAYDALAQSAIDARFAAKGEDGQGKGDPTTPPKDKGLETSAKAGVDQLALLKDAAERALVALDHLYEDGKVSVAAYYAEKVRLQQESIDADILAAQRTAAASKVGSKERADALTQVIILERERRDVAVTAARDQLKAEEDLVDQLGQVQVKLLESEGKTARARKAELEAEYRDLIVRLGVQADAAGVALVRKLINVEAAKAGLDQLKTQFSDVTGALSQLQATTSAQVSAGLLSNATAEKRIAEARDKALEQLKAQRQAVAELYAEYANPEALLQLQALDEQIATLSISTEDWRGKLQDAGTGALTTFFKELVDGSTSAGDAVRNLAVNFTQALAAMAAQALAKKAISAIFDAFGGGEDAEDAGAAKIASAAAAGLAYAAPVTTAATALGIAGGVVTSGAVAITAAAAALQAAATTLLIANSVSSVSAAHAGGVVGALNMTRTVHPAMFANAPRYHSGGVAGLAPDEYPTVLQRGEEVITRRDKRHRYNGGLDTEAKRSTPQRFIFVDDQRKGEELLRSAVGEEATLLNIGKNPGAVRELLGL